MSILINNHFNAAFRSVAAAAFAAAALVSVPAQGKELVVVESAEIFAAYQVICLANPGNLNAQVAAAKAAPYNFSLIETTADGSMRYENPRLFVAMRKDAKNHFCMVGGRLPDGTKLEAGAAVGAPVLDKLAPRMLTNEQMVMWSDVKAKPVLLYMYSHTVASGITVGSFLTGVSQDQ